MLARKMAEGLGLPFEYIHNTSLRATHMYRTYTVPKRSGGSRTIYHPSKELKALQRWLVHHVVSTLPVHQSAFAYRPGKSIRDHADQHRRSRFLLRLDLVDFFPSIKSDDLSTFMQSARSDYDQADLAFLCRLVCRFGELTIGSPSSPGLSNAICLEMDNRLDALARRFGSTYTRYADDLYFSSELPGQLSLVEKEACGIVETLDLPKMLRVNHKKTRHMSRKGRRQITGLILTSDGNTSLGRDRKRSVRTRVHLLNTLSSDEKLKLAGDIAYCRGIEPDFYNRLVLKFGASLMDAASSMVAVGMRVSDPS